MAEYRSVQTRMWREDEWFQNLPTDARLFWVYLFSNPSASICGIYRLPIRTMANECGLSEKRISELLKSFASDGKAHYEQGVVWVVRMRENQLGPKISDKQLRGIENDLAKVPPCPLKNRYLEHYRYPTDTLCIPRVTDTDTDTVTDTHTDTGTETVTNGPIGPAADAAPPKPPRPTLVYPEPVKVFLANGGQFQSGKLADGTPKRERAVQFICEHVGADPPALKLWGEVVNGYVNVRSWSPTSYTVMVNDYYCKGIVPGSEKQAHGPGSNGKLPPALEAARRSMEEDARNGNQG